MTYLSNRMVTTTPEKPNKIFDDARRTVAKIFITFSVSGDLFALFRSDYSYDNEFLDKDIVPNRYEKFNGKFRVWTLQIEVFVLNFQFGSFSTHRVSAAEDG